jgi:hypothetical protein
MNRQRLKTFFRRHNQWLTIIGALIVFLTFVVNDILRERLKDMASSIANAQDVLSIRTDIQRFATQNQRNQMRLKNEILSEVAELHPLPIGPIPQLADMPEDYISEVNQSLQDDFYPSAAINAFDRVSRLMRGMHEEQATNRELESLRMEEKNLGRALQDLIGAEIHLQAAIKADNEKPTPDLKVSLDAFGHQFIHYQKREMSWYGSVGKLERDSTEGFRSEGRCRTPVQDVHVFSYFSYFLYFIGWSLPLLGRLYGVQSSHLRGEPGPG